MWLQLVLHATFLLLGITAGQGGLRSQSTTCVCPGHNVSYECTVRRTENTTIFIIWRGSAFDCTSDGNGIFLSPNDGSISCNDEIVGKVLDSVSNKFTTQLTVNITAELNGSYVECLQEINQTITSTVGQLKIILTDAFPPPMNVTLDSFNHGEICFSWKRNSIDFNCSSIFYKIHQTGCGECSLRVNESIHANCSLPSEFLNCTLSIRSVTCDHIEGTLSDPVHVSLTEVPSLPSHIEIIPRYSQKSKQLTKLTVNFRYVEDQYYISDGIFMLDYTSRYDVVYTTSANGVIHHCDNETILTDSCVNDICISSLSFLSGSQTQCASGDDVVVSVYATNGLGVAVTNSTADGINQLVSIEFNSMDVICNFMNSNQQVNSELSCNITYGPCGNLTSTKYGISTDSFGTVKIRLSNIKQRFCYVIDASNGNDTVQVEGMYMYTGITSQPYYIAGVIAAVLLSSLIVAVTIIVSLIYFTKGRLVFSIKSKPGALVSALEVLKEHNVNITRIKMRPLGNFSNERILFIICQNLKQHTRNYILTRLNNLDDVTDIYNRCHPCGVPRPWRDRMTDSRTTKFISFKVAKNESGSIFAALKCFKDLNINIMDLKTRTFSTSDRRMISVHVKSEFDEIIMEEVKKGLKAGGAIFTGELTADSADDYCVCCLPCF